MASIPSNGYAEVMAGTNNYSGSNSYDASCPRTAIPPVIGNDLTNKTYVDAATGGGIVGTLTDKGSLITANGTNAVIFDQNPYQTALTTTTVYDWNALAIGQSRDFTTTVPTLIPLGAGITITYSFTDSIKGNVTAVAGTTITITITNLASAAYSSTFLLQTSGPNGAGGNTTNGTFPFNSAVTTPNPPNIPANTIITNGVGYIYTTNAGVPVSITANIIGSNIQRPSATPFTTIPFQNPTVTPTNFNFPSGCFVGTTQSPSVQFFGGTYFHGFPAGSSFIPLNYVGSLSGYNVGYGTGVISIDDDIALIADALSPTGLAWGVINTASIGAVTSVSGGTSIVMSGTVPAPIVNLNIANNNTNATYYPTFVAGVGTQALLADTTTGPISLNPSNGNFNVVNTLKLTQTSLAVGKNAGLTSQSAVGAVAVGEGAGETGQGQDGVAVGPYAGNSNQSQYAVAVGSDAGNISQGDYSVAVGTQAGNSNQGDYSIAIGFSAGQTSQGLNAVAVGLNAGTTSQTANAVAIGELAGTNAQGGSAVAIGHNAGRGLTSGQGTSAVAIGHNSARTSQGLRSVAIGLTAGDTTQGDDAIAIGNEAGKTTQGLKAIAVGINAGTTSQTANAVAIGELAGTNAQGGSAVAIGHNAGRGLTSGQGTSAVAIGHNSARTSQGLRSVAIGLTAGDTTQGNDAIAIGNEAGKTSQGADAIAIGRLSGTTSQVGGAIAIGYTAGQTSQKINAVAIGSGAGVTSQAAQGIAIGSSAGATNQLADAVAIGNSAGNSGQGGGSVAIGYIAGQTNQSSNSVAIGSFAGVSNQGQNCVAIGVEAGRGTTTGQGNFAIAIGSKAGVASQLGGSICINASNSAVNPTQAGCYIRPMRGVALGIGVGRVFYDVANWELVYSTS